MLLQPTLHRLRELKLLGMASALEEQSIMPDVRSLDFEDRLAHMGERERACREDRRLTRLLQLARLQVPAAAEDTEYRRPRGLDRGLMMKLSACHWIEANEAVLLSRATGTGKSYIACALGHSACRRGFTTRYYRFFRMLGEFARARADGSYPKLLGKLAGARNSSFWTTSDSPLTDSERRDMLEVLEDRYGRRATLSPASCPLTTGMRSSETPHSRTPFSTVWSTAHIASR